MATVGGETIKNASEMGTDTTSNGYKEAIFALVFLVPGLASQNRRLHRFRSWLFPDPLFPRSLDALYMTNSQPPSSIPRAGCDPILLI